MKLSSFVAVVAPLAMAVGASAQGFYNSCHHNWYMDGKYMVAECRRVDGSYMRTRHDMNLCVANYGGNLASANMGGFAGSCYSCRNGAGIIYDGMPPSSSLSCICGNGAGGSGVSQLDLNTFVSNIDGYLWCHGHRSAPY